MARVIKGQLYRVFPQCDMGSCFVECANENELMEFLVEHYYGRPITVALITTYGKSPKVAVYTNPYYKQLVKNRQAIKK
jgi:siroheme synthase (precorrin-2 oxidase/ferrochelatase)